VQEFPNPPPPVLFLKVHGRQQMPLMRDGALLRSLKAMLAHTRRTDTCGGFASTE
jgi:hypothetical protein